MAEDKPKLRRKWTETPEVLRSKERKKIFLQLHNNNEIFFYKFIAINIINSKSRSLSVIIRIVVFVINFNKN